MKRIIITLTSVMLVVLAFSQTDFKTNNGVKLDAGRLSPRLLNYQGFLTDTLGNPINNLSLSLSFAIFDSPSGGNQKWSETQASVVVIKGIFNVLLGSVSPIPDSVFTAGTDRWLELIVAGQNLTPRTQITSVGYAYTAIYSDTAQYARSFSAHNHLGESWATTTINRALLMKINRDTSSIINGLVDSVLNAGTGTAYGGQFFAGGSGSGSKYGIYASGNAYSGSSNPCYGTFGYSSHAGTGYTYGGYFYGGGAGYGQKYGVYAEAIAPSGSGSHAYGGYFYGLGSGSSQGYGVYATGSTYAGYFEGTGTYGIYATGGSIAAGYFYGTGTYGIRAYGSATSTYAGYFNGLGTYGVYATGGTSSAGYFYGTGTSGVYVDGTSTYGVYVGQSSPGSYGVYVSSTYAPAYGVRAAGTTYAGYFVGNHLITGTKSAAVKISDGDWRLLYCQESPELWFEDFGEGQLQNGKARIELEPIFLKTVTISDEHPMKVFVQLADDCSGVYVKRGKTGFDVIELKNGTSNASFTYRVVAKRQGYENLRLKKMEPGTNPDDIRAANENR